MEGIRRHITSNYENLKQLEDYEELLEYLNDKGKGHWWQINTPNKEVSIYTDEARQNLRMFILDEVIRIRSELGIED